MVALGDPTEIITWNNNNSSSDQRQPGQGWDVGHRLIEIILLMLNFYLLDVDVIY